MRLSSWKLDFMIIGLVSDFLPECKSKRIFGLFKHQAGTFGVKSFICSEKLWLYCRDESVPFSENRQLSDQI